MKFLSKEKISKNMYIDNSGYLICKDAVLARTGKQQYRHNELYHDSDDDSIIDIDRPEKEVFDEKTLASFENKPICDEHPDVDVTPENHSELAVGFVRDVHRGEDNGQPVMLGTLVITDADVIDEVQNGKRQLSCGYDCDLLDDGAGMYQCNIRGNHVALCEEGRAGIARIVDSKLKDISLDRLLEKATSTKKDEYEITTDEFDVDDIERFLEKKGYTVTGYHGGNKVSNYVATVYFVKDSTNIKDTAMQVTVQCYIFDGDKILIQDRTSSMWHGLAVPGGHVQFEESTAQACIREIKEETGLDINNLVLFGTHQYTCDEDGECIALLYKTSTFSGELQSSNEGNVMWMSIDEVLVSNNCAEGFKDLLTKAYTKVKDSINDGPYTVYIDEDEFNENAYLQSLKSHASRLHVNLEKVGKTIRLVGNKQNVLDFIKECKYIRKVLNTSAIINEVKDSVSSEIASGEYRNGYLRVMTKQEYDNAIRNNRLTTVGDLFSNLSRAKEFAKRKGDDYVVVNLINNKIVDNKVDDSKIYDMPAEMQDGHWIKSSSVYDVLDEYLEWEGIRGYTREILEVWKTKKAYIDGEWKKFTFAEDALSAYLEWEGIIGYDYTIMDIIKTKKAYIDDSIKDASLTEEYQKETERNLAKWGAKEAKIWRETNWKARNFKPLLLANNSFRQDVKVVGTDIVLKNVKFVLEISPNTIYEPRYVPEAQYTTYRDYAWTYDGRKKNGYIVLDRADTWGNHASMFYNDSSKKLDIALKIAKIVKLHKDSKKKVSDMSVPLEQVDAKNYVVAYNNPDVWFAKPQGEKELFKRAYYSIDKGQTWHLASLETKSAGSNTRTQQGKFFFRSHSPRTAIGRNVLTWYANKGIHTIDPSQHIDHVNEDYTDDRFDNLKRIPAKENLLKSIEYRKSKK